jgi:hypothetical protein
MSHGVGDGPVIEDYLRDVCEVGPLIESPLQIPLGALYEVSLEVISEKGKHELSSCIDALSAHMVSIVLVCESNIS